MRSVTISKWGNSLGVRLPKQIAEKAGLKAGSKVEVELCEEGTITIKLVPFRPRYELHELLSQISPENRHSELAWGDDEGKEKT